MLMNLIFTISFQTHASPLPQDTGSYNLSTSMNLSLRVEAIYKYLKKQRKGASAKSAR